MQKDMQAIGCVARDVTKELQRVHYRAGKAGALLRESTEPAEEKQQEAEEHREQSEVSA